jgi:ribosomal protein S18 acetylase RimI-like enzyme
VLKLERSVSSRRWGVQLAGIVVDPKARYQGLGRAAVAAAVRAALAEGPPGRLVSLHVRADNRAALVAYEAAGFIDREPWRLAVRP